MIIMDNVRALRVAPARERGLKFGDRAVCLVDSSRSREGAWIEMFERSNPVWYNIVAPARERGLKFPRWSGFGHMVTVAPARERGLKSWQ